jgi:hypothetical protein
MSLKVQKNKTASSFLFQIGTIFTKITQVPERNIKRSVICIPIRDAMEAKTWARIGTNTDLLFKWFRSFRYPYITPLISVLARINFNSDYSVESLLCSNHFVCTNSLTLINN